MKEIYDFHRRENNWADFAARGMTMKILYPEKEKDMNLDEEAWRGVTDLLEEYRSQKKWWYFPSLAGKIKIMFSHRSDELDIDEEAWEGIRTQLQTFRDEKNWISFSVQALKMRLLSVPDGVLRLAIRSHFVQEAIEKFT